MPAKTAVLKLNDLSLFVHLGCSAEEQQSPQEIRVSFEFRFSEIPKACLSDALEDTICYGTVSEAIRAFCTRAPFNTIEKIAMGCYEILQNTAISVAKNGVAPGVRVRVHKMKPPVDSLLGGAVFEIESDTHS